MTAYKGELEIGKLGWATLRIDLLILANAFNPAAGQGEKNGDITMTTWKIWLVATQLLLAACATNGGATPPPPADDGRNDGGGSVSSGGGMGGGTYFTQ